MLSDAEWKRAENRGGFYDFRARKVGFKRKRELEKELNNPEKLFATKETLLLCRHAASV